MLNPCPECGMPELVWDGYEHYQGEEGGQCICQNCGVVVAVCDLTNEDKFQNNQVNSAAPLTARERIAYAIRNQRVQLSRGHCEGVKFTQRISQCLECGQSMTAEAVALFRRFYQHDLFRLRSMSIKQTLAGCCVYITCRRHNWPITVGSVAAYTDGGVYAMRALKNELLANFDDLADIRPPDMSELVELQSARTRYSDFVRDTLMKIILLCRDAWISEGRRPELVIAAASYVAWQSEDPKTRGKKSVRDFCSAHRLSYSTSIESMAKEIKSTMIQLATQIPWLVDGNVSVKNVIWHVSDILQYRCTLEAEVITNFLQNVQSDSPSNVSIAKVDCDGIRPADAEVDSKRGVLGSTVMSASTGSPPQQSQSNLGPFLPKSFRSPRRRVKRLQTDGEESSCSYSGNLDSPDLGNDDIRDEDMRLYIKTDAEVTNCVELPCEKVCEI